MVRRTIPGLDSVRVEDMVGVDVCDECDECDECDACAVVVRYGGGTSSSDVVGVSLGVLDLDSYASFDVREVSDKMEESCIFICCTLFNMSVASVPGSIRSSFVKTPMVRNPSGSTDLAIFNASELARSVLPAVTARMIALGFEM